MNASTTSKRCSWQCFILYNFSTLKRHIFQTLQAHSRRVARTDTVVQRLTGLESSTKPCQSEGIAIHYTMAVAATFSTYELLEQKLLLLPTRHLLLSQRVCKQWRDVIKRSQRIL